MAGRKQRSRAAFARPRKATRRHRVRVWVERGVLGVMMTVVAAVVERRLLKVIRSGDSSKSALPRAERSQERSRRATAPERDAAVAAGPDVSGQEANSSE